jgi:flagellar hook-basal body complex protein FliE
MSLINALQGLGPSAFRGVGSNSNKLIQDDIRSLAESTRSTGRVAGSTPIEGLSAPGSAAHESAVFEATLAPQVDRPVIDPGAAAKDFIHAVDGKRKAGAEAAQKVMIGESDNIHQSMIAVQESSVAFTMLVEVRNKLMESYQQLMRMRV